MPSPLPLPPSHRYMRTTPMNSMAPLSLVYNSSTVHASDGDTVSRGVASGLYLWFYTQYVTVK